MGKSNDIQRRKTTTGFIGESFNSKYLKSKMVYKVKAGFFDFWFLSILWNLTQRFFASPHQL